ncbi:hypothetical protein D3C85_1905100 [compost metagenome]
MRFVEFDLAFFGVGHVFGMLFFLTRQNLTLSIQTTAVGRLQEFVGAFVTRSDQARA